MFKGKKECGTGTIERLTKSTSQMQRVPSLEPVASLLPSGENRQNQTSSLCWDNTWVVVHGNWSLQTQQRTYSEWVSEWILNTIRLHSDIHVGSGWKIVSKKLKPDKFFMGKPSQNYGCHRSMVLTILFAARHKRAHPALTPAGEGWYSIYLPRRDGRLSWPGLW